MSEGARYVPAAGRRAFERLYDPAIALTVRERTFRPALQRQVLAATASGATVADVGCGTGTFAARLAKEAPDRRVVGIDGDPGILERARGKPGAERVDWRVGLADDLPLEDGEAGAVVMSLLLHHLVPEAKGRALAEAHRVLAPGGTLHVADWGRPHGPVMRGAFLLLQALDGFENTRDHAAGRLPGIVVAAGFADVTSTLRLRTPWGSLELLRAARS